MEIRLACRNSREKKLLNTNLEERKRDLTSKSPSQQKKRKWGIGQAWILVKTKEKMESKVGNPMAVTEKNDDCP